MVGRQDLVVRFVGDTGDLTRGLDQLQGRFRATATTLQGIATAGAVVGAAGFLKSAITKASDLQETTSKTGVVFGAAAARIQEFASSASKSLGQSQRSAMDAASTFATFGKGAGLSGDALADFSTKLVVLASDMASFSNTSPEEAIEAIGAALRGENDPIEKYGVLLNEATIAQQALKMGLITTTKDALTPQQRVLAAQAAILAQTSDAQGDFARTSTGLANQQRILAAEWENSAAKLGQAFLPLATEAVTLLNKGVIPAVTQAGEVVGDVLVPALRFLWETGQDIAGLFGDLPGPIQAGVIALIAWRLAGSGVTSTLSGMSSPLRSAVGDFKAFHGELGTVGAGMLVLEDRVPVVASMGTAFRATKGEAEGLGATLRGSAAAGFAGLHSAATGVMGLLGGPLGIAVTAITIGVGLWAQRSAEAKQRQQELADAGKSVAAAIREQNGVLNENVRQVAAKAAEDRGLLKTAEQLGVPLSDITDSIVGQGDSYQRLTGSVRGTIAEKERMISQLAAESQYQADANTVTAVSYDWALRRIAALQGEVAAGNDFLGTLGAIVAGKNDQVNADLRVAAASGSATSAQQGLKSAQDVGALSAHALTQVVADLGGKFDASKTAGQNLAAAIRGITDAATAAIETEEAYEASVDALTQSVITNGATLDIHTEKGRANRDALEAAAGAIRDMTLADLESGVPMNEAIGRHDQRTGALQREAEKAGFSRDQTALLIEKYGQVPGNVRTVIETIGYEATYQKLLDMNLAQRALAEGISVRTAKGLYGGETAIARQATGGPVVGPGGPRSDKIPSLLSAGEWVHQASAVDYYGTGVMAALNARRIPKEVLRMAQGGYATWPMRVDTTKAKVPAFASMVQAMAAVNLAGAGAGGVQRWAPLVLQVLAMLGQPASLLPNVLRRMNQESGGSPTAINRWDVNAQRGTPSIGLMQTIAPTFNRWAGPFLARGIYDPLANIYAGLNYAIHRYPSLQYAMDKPGGYGAGGVVPGPAGRPRMAIVHGGEEVLTREQRRSGATPTVFTGNLYLDSGQFLGAVRGTVRDALRNFETEAGPV